LQILGGAFTTWRGIEDSYERLQQMNRTLEIKVQERTASWRTAIATCAWSWTTSPRVSHGLDLGAAGARSSAIVDRWFGSYDGATSRGLHREVDVLYAASFAMGYEALIETSSAGIVYRADAGPPSL